MQADEFILIWLVLQLIPGMVFWSFWWFDIERIWKKYGYYNIKGTDLLMAALFPVIVLTAVFVAGLGKVLSCLLNLEISRRTAGLFTKTLFLVEKKEKCDEEESSK